MPDDFESGETIPKPRLIGLGTSEPSNRTTPGVSMAGAEKAERPSAPAPIRDFKPTYVKEGDMHAEIAGGSGYIIDGPHRDTDLLLRSIQDVYTKLGTSNIGGTTPRAKFLNDMCRIYHLSTQAVSSAATDEDFSAIMDELESKPELMVGLADNEPLISKVTDKPDPETDVVDAGTDTDI